MLYRFRPYSEQGVLDAADRGVVGGARDAVADHEGLREQLEGCDRPDDQVEQDRGADHRDRHVAQLHPRPGAVDLCRLVQGPRHALERAQVDDHDVAGGPDHQQDQPVLGPARIEEPAGPLDAEERQHLVEEAGRRVEQEHEQERPSDHGDHDGQVEDRAEDPQPADPAVVEQEGDPEGHEDRQRDPDDRQVQGVAQRLPEHGVLEQVGVVVEPNPARRLQDLEVREAVVEGRERRVQGEAEEPDQPRRDEQQPGAEPLPLGPREPAPTPATARGSTRWRRALRLGRRRHGRGLIEAFPSGSLNQS